MSRRLLAGERIWLRPMERSDLAAYAAGVNDPLVGEPAGYQEPIGLAAAERWYGRVTERTASGEGLFFAICEAGADQFIGTTWLKNLDLRGGTAELAIYLDRNHLAQGIGSEAQRVLLDFAFGELRLERVYLTVSPSNARAIASYEKVGFRHEGTTPAARIHRGVVEDVVTMGITRATWAAQDRTRSWETADDSA